MGGRDLKPERQRCREVKSLAVQSRSPTRSTGTPGSWSDTQSLGPCHRPAELDLYFRWIPGESLWIKV